MRGAAVDAERQAKVDRIRRFPAELEALVSGLSSEDLHTHYLENEWTVAQNVHHLADSHMNSFIRIKLMLTEDNPTIKPYKQDSWALTPEAHGIPVESSLLLLKGLHERWALLFEQVDESAWSRTVTHPENGTMTLDNFLNTYSRHCDAHIDQIQRTLAAKG